MNYPRDIARLVSRGKQHDRALGAYLKWRVEEALRKEQFKTAAELAKAAGLSPPAIAGVRKDGRGTGGATVRGLAKAFGVTASEIYAAADAWAKDHASELGVQVSRDRYPNRAIAAEICRAGKIDPAVIDDVLGDAHLSETDEDVLWWINTIQMRAHLRQRPSVGTAITPATTKAPPRGRRTRRT